MSAPKLSIILAAYNSEKYIKDCIESVLNQNGGDYEFIVVDDGSNDSTPEILAQFEKQSKFIKVISQLNKGRSEARNRGILDARGKYIWIIDHDDLISRNCIAPIINVLETLDLDVLAVAPPQKFVKDCSSLNSKELLENGVTPVVQGKRFLLEDGSYWAPWQFVINREFFNLHKFSYKLRYFLEDIELMYRVLYYAERFAAWKDFSCYSYIQRPESETKNPWTKNKILDYARYLNLVEDFVVANAMEKDIRRVFELKRTQFYINGINNWKTIRDKMDLTEYLENIHSVPNRTYGSIAERLYQLLSFFAPQIFAKIR